MNIQEKAEQYARAKLGNWRHITHSAYETSQCTNGEVSVQDYTAGYNEAKRWIPVGEQTPPEGEDVLFFNLKWIHPDFNIKGVRIGYLNMNIYHTAKCYDDIYSHRESDEPNEVEPTHWREI